MMNSIGQPRRPAAGSGISILEREEPTKPSPLESPDARFETHSPLREAGEYRLVLRCHVSCDGELP